MPDEYFSCLFLWLFLFLSLPLFPFLLSQAMHITDLKCHNTRDELSLRDDTAPGRKNSQNWREVQGDGSLDMGSQGPDLDLGLCIQQQAVLASPGGQQALPAGEAFVWAPPSPLPRRIRALQRETEMTRRQREQLPQILRVTGSSSPGRRFSISYPAPW